MSDTTCSICGSSVSDTSFYFCAPCTGFLTQASHLLKSQLEEENEILVEQLRLMEESISAEKYKSAENSECEVIQNLENNLTKLQEEKCALKLKVADLVSLEQKLLNQINNWQRCTLEQTNILGQVTAFQSTVEERLMKLRKTNVLNDAFFIWHAGTGNLQIATINGFRLGRIPPEVNVSWEEINIALGMVCQLLDVIIRIKRLKLESGIPIPKGASSGISKDGEFFELFETRGSLARIFSGKSLDAGFVVLLDCVKDIFDKSKGICNPPFLMEGEQVEGISIRLTVSGDLEWTKAMRLLLTNLKWLISYTDLSI